MTLRHISAAEVRHQQRETQREREIKREREGRKPKPTHREEKGFQLHSKKVQNHFLSQKFCQVTHLRDLKVSLASNSH